MTTTTTVVATTRRLNLADELAKSANIPAAVREGADRFQQVLDHYGNAVSDEWSMSPADLVADLIHYLDLLSDDSLETVLAEAKRLADQDRNAPAK